MMDDTKLEPAAGTGPAASETRMPADARGPVTDAQDAVPAESGRASAPVSPAVERFRSCRWRAAPEDGEYCTHRDVLPFAGKDGFVAESWCPDCAFYKLRRTPKKREKLDYPY